MAVDPPVNWRHFTATEVAVAVDPQQPWPQRSGLGGEGPHDRRAEARLVGHHRQTRAV